MDILIIPKENNKSAYDFKILCDNVVVGMASEEGEDDTYMLFLKTNILELTSNYTIKEIFYLNDFKVASFSLPIDINNYKNLDWIDEKESCMWFNDLISLRLVPRFLNWNKSIDLISFNKKLEEYFKDDKEITVDTRCDILIDGIYIDFKIKKDQNFKFQYFRILSMINIAIENLFKELEKPNINSLVNRYSFPTEIRIACEQYLLYFAKFLEDLDINVSTRIDSQTNNTLFTIIPNNSKEALSKIREILNIYLSLPEISNIEILTKDHSDVSVQQLTSVIYLLKSQLRLANSVIQAKDSTIENLKLINYQKSIDIERFQPLITNEEKILDGLITINEYEGKAFKIDLPEIFRRLKRRKK